MSMKADVEQKLESLVKKMNHRDHGLVAVRNGKIQLCLDPVNLNKGILRNPYPMLTFDDVLSEFEGAKVCSLCDAKDGFLQYRLSEKAADLTTFWTPFSCYKWKRMPFGLSTSPEKFQRPLMENLGGSTGNSGGSR